MDKKTKKRLEVLRKKVGDLQRLVVGATEQPDDPEELAQLKSKLEATHEEIRRLKDR